MLPNVAAMVIPHKASYLQSSGPSEATAKLEVAKLEERRQKIYNLIIQEKQVELKLHYSCSTMVSRTLFLSKHTKVRFCRVMTGDWQA